MRYRLIFGVALGALLLTLAGCKESPLEPAITVGDEPTGPPRPDFPPVADPVGIYDRVTHSYVPGSSRYVFYGDSTFSLQYVRPDWGFFEYRGRYARAGSRLAFDFDDENSAGAWLADGSVHGDSLVVTYNLIMMLADFEDGLYVRTSDASAAQAADHLLKEAP